MERQLGVSELPESVISWLSTVEGCPLSGVPLYLFMMGSYVPSSVLASLRVAPAECSSWFVIQEKRLNE